MKTMIAPSESRQIILDLVDRQQAAMEAGYMFSAHIAPWDNGFGDGRAHVTVRHIDTCYPLPQNGHRSKRKWSQSFTAQTVAEAMTQALDWIESRQMVVL